MPMELTELNESERRSLILGSIENLVLHFQYQTPNETIDYTALSDSVRRVLTLIEETE